MNVFLGALISALIPLVSSIVAIFASNPELEFSGITTAAWVAIVGGGIVAFLKGTQSITIRRLISKATKSRDGGI